MGIQEPYDIRFNMYSFYIILFLSFIHLGMLLETKEFNRINKAPLTQLIPSELLENILKYNENGAPVKSKVCDSNKNTPFRLSDEEERNRMPILNRKTMKLFESPNNKVDSVKIDYSQLHKLTFVNNSSNQNLDQFRELRQLQTLSNTLLHEFRSNESVIGQQDEDVKFIKAKENETSFSNVKKEKVPIDLRKDHNHVDNNKSDSASEQLIATQTPEYISNSTSRKSATGKTINGNIGKSISNDPFNIDSEDNLQGDTSVSSESNEFNSDIDKQADSNNSKELVTSNKDNDVNESVSIEYIDKSNLDLNNIKERLDSKNGIKMTELSNSRVLLMESHRICYACGSYSDPSCLKPNRQTTVKYCHKDNTACVAKSYTIGRSNYIIRDCGSSCMSSDKNGLAIKYETCSICHSDLCNSAYSINMFIAPLILLAIVINRIIY